MPDLKDDGLAKLASQHNVARFVSIGPSAEGVRHAYLNRRDSWKDSESAIAALLAEAKTVNVRTFRPDRQQGNPFHYGLKSLVEVQQLVRGLCDDGYYVIVNETIDVADGGVSGVLDGDIIEFSPDDTPRAVEKPGICTMPTDIGIRMLDVVYGLNGELVRHSGSRVEFSVHPNRVGFRSGHVLIWEIGESANATTREPVSWPNHFSRMIGDKAFGLLFAQVLGLPVPRTTVVGRRVAPFSFGTPTGTSEWWIRTCPVEQVPGKYTTTRQWQDPFALLGREDPAGKQIASVLAQESVQAAYSGATLPSTRATVIEGVFGFGDEFMLGVKTPGPLPDSVVDDVRLLSKSAEDLVGSAVRLEWVHDGKRPWVVQMHVVSRPGQGVLSEGQPTHGWIEFDPNEGLEALEAVIAKARASRKGVHVTRAIGITSHVGDLLRKSEIPARFA